MNKELETYYDAQFDLFIQPGWKDFLEDVEKLKTNLPTVEQLDSEKALYKVKGQLDILNWVLQRKQLVELEYEDLTNN